MSRKRRGTSKAAQRRARRREQKAAENALPVDLLPGEGRRAPKDDPGRGAYAVTLQSGFFSVLQCDDRQHARIRAAILAKERDTVVTSIEPPPLNQGMVMGGES